MAINPTSPASQSTAKARHCDDYIADDTQPESLRRWLGWARLSATQKYPSGTEPILFATYQPPDDGKTLIFDRGRRCRVVMASRFGDVGIRFTDLLGANYGYSTRCPVEHLIDFSETP